MKKAFVFSLVVLVLFSVIVFAKETAEKNPMVDKLEEIKQVLLNILEKLGLIADKETSITVQSNITFQPNITVQPPEINVYPDVNISIPEKECKWEKLVEEVIPYRFLITGERDYKDYFILLEDKQYSEFQITKIDAFFHYTNVDDYVNFSVNRVSCFSTGARDTKYLHQDWTFCKDAFESGLNVGMEIRCCGGGTVCCGGGTASFTLDKLVIEYSVKPASC